MPPGRLAAIALSLLSGGCVIDADLRDPNRHGDLDEPAPGDPACPSGERVDPETGACAACAYENPNAVCPCGYMAQPGPFPLCDHPNADFTCTTPCQGSIEVCTGYQVVEGRGLARDCGLLLSCCRSLAGAPGATPCCEPGESLLCYFPSGVEAYPYVPGCVDNRCCGGLCGGDGDCDPSFQTCDLASGRCTPGCDSDTAYCDTNVCSCRSYGPG